MIQGRDFLRAFEFLSGMDDEVGARTQTSRAYYAAYLETRTHCENHFEYLRHGGGREHTDVQRLIASQDSEVADNLAFLRRLLNIADYNLNIRPSTITEQAAESGKLAKSIIAHLDELASVSTNDAYDQ
ncbi:hypothetical protein BH24CHL3_BH24CHL3_12270 [soil metagenome]